MGIIADTYRTPVRSNVPAKPKPEEQLDIEGVAEKAGLQEEAEKIKKEKGEDPERIFSGGHIRDIFDTLSILQYGVVGTLKGKGFMEGVKTRASFTDLEDVKGDTRKKIISDTSKDIGTRVLLPGAVAPVREIVKRSPLGEIPRVIGGIALDIAVDPLTYLGGTGLLSKAQKAPKAVKAGKEIAETVAQVGAKIGEKIPLAKEVGNRVGRAVIYRFGQDKVYRELAERSYKNIHVGIQNMIDIARPLTKLDSETQRLVAEARKAGKLDDLPPEVLDKARPAFAELDRLGKEAVEAGLLKAETYQQNVGKYIARLYRKFEVPEEGAEKVTKFFESKPIRIGLERFKGRKDIPDEVREAMGEVLEAGYPTAKALTQLTQAVERAKFFGAVAKSWGKDTAEEGLKRLSDAKTLGKLAGKYVPEPIFHDIEEIIRAKKPTERALNKIVGGFKFGKVILNPASWARNRLSNYVLNSFEGLNPLRQDIYVQAGKEIKNKGTIYQEAKQMGLGINTFAAQEIKDMLMGPEGLTAMKKFGAAAKEIIKKLSDGYEKEEQLAKMAQYIYQKSKGLSPEDAWKIAERATFNYAQVTPFIRRLRESIWGFPFITFTVKVTPQVARTLVTHPERISIYGKIARGIEEATPEEEQRRIRAAEPQWVKDGFYVILPMKDKHGRSALFDLSYIFPFGDLVSGQFFERGINRETGLPEGLPTALLRKSPLLSFIRDISKNQDFFGNKIWKESDDTSAQLGDLFRHFLKTYLPPLISDQIPGGYRASGEQRPGAIQRALQGPPGEEQGGKQERTMLQEVLRNIGLKITPVDIGVQEGFMENEINEALETLLKEHGILREFRKTFVPKGAEEKVKQRNPLLEKYGL